MSRYELSMYGFSGCVLWIEWTAQSRLYGTGGFLCCFQRSYDFDVKQVIFVMERHTVLKGKKLSKRLRSNQIHVYSRFRSRITEYASETRAVNMAEFGIWSKIRSGQRDGKDKVSKWPWREQIKRCQCVELESQGTSPEPKPMSSVAMQKKGLQAGVGSQKSQQAFSILSVIKGQLKH